MKRWCLLTVAGLFVGASDAALAQEKLAAPKPKTVQEAAPAHPLHDDHHHDYYMPEGHHGWGWFHAKKGHGAGRWLRYRPLPTSACRGLRGCEGGGCTPSLNAYFQDQYYMAGPEGLSTYGNPVWATPQARPGYYGNSYYGNGLPVYFGTATPQTKQK